MMVRAVKFGVLAIVASVALAEDPSTTAPLSSATSSSSTTMESPTRPVFPGKLSVRIRPAAGDQPSSWQLGYAGKKLAGGDFARDGAAFVAAAELPADIKVRCEFAFLVVMSSGRNVTCGIVAYPMSALEIAADKIKSAHLGIVDSTGKIANALTGEKAQFETLKTDHARDSFVGGAAIIGGVDDKNRLADLCGRMEGRVRDGMGLIILNPPDGWEGFGVRSCHLVTPRVQPVGHCKDTFELYNPADIGQGPWREYLAYDGAKVSELIWLDSPAGSSQNRVALAVSAEIGKGTIVVANIPALDSVDVDAVGRRVLCRLILELVEKGVKS